MSDADRLRYIAQYPGVLPFLHDIFTGPEVKGEDKLEVLRATLDHQIRVFPNGCAE